MLKLIALSACTRMIVGFLVIALTGCSHFLSQSKNGVNDDPVVGLPEVIEPVVAGSYWNNAIQYPFAVSYAKTLDASKQLWTLAFIDEYTGPKKKEEAPVVVLVHCRCGNLGYFTRLIHKLRTEYRVIAFDLPHYGKSLPANMGLPVNQSFAHSRQLIHQVLAGQLQIKKVSLIGHSLGGQWVLGFALDYPDYVDALVLESSYGLESYIEKEVLSAGGKVNLYDKKFTSGKAMPDSVWRINPLLVREYGLSEIDLEARFSSLLKHDDPTLPLWAKKSKLEGKKGAKSDAASLKHEQPDARFFVRSRALAAFGDPQEYDRLVKSCVWDIYASAAELKHSDKKSLPSRLNQVRARTFLAFGQQDSFLPNRLLTGNQNLRDDLIQPALTSIRIGSAASVAKIYPYAAHAPHLDVPEHFENDVLTFLEGRVVDAAF